MPRSRYKACLQDPPLVPKSVEDQPITWIEKRPSPSRELFRPDRRDNATSALKSCIDFLMRFEAFFAELGMPDQAIIRLREQLESDVKAFDSVFFPGMSGR
jgi:hypothetical protein